MRTFVLRARAAPTDSQKLLAGVGKEAHTEILAHTLMNAIFVAQSHRPDVVVYLVLESTQDFSRTVRFEASAMHDIGESVTVRYDASDPSRAEIASSTAVKVLGGSALLLFSGVGVAAGWLLLRLRGKSGGTAPHAPRD